VIFVYLDGLGLGPDIINIKILDKYYILNIFSLFAILYLIFTRKKKNILSNNEMLLPSKLIFILLFVTIIYSFVQVADGDLNLNTFIFNAINFIVYVFFLSIVFNIQSIIELKKLLDGILIFAIISSLIVFLSIVFGFETRAIKVMHGAAITHKFRLYLPTAMLMIFAFYYALNRYFLERKGFIYIVLALFIGVAFLGQMHRSVIISFILSFVVYIFFLPTRTFSNKIKFWGIGLISFFLIAYFTLSAISLDFAYLLSSLNITTSEVESGSGNFWLRLFVLQNTIKDVTSNYLILGRGLNWLPIDTYQYAFAGISYSPTFDNTITNIIIVFGLSGVFVFGYFFYKAIKISYLLSYSNIDMEIKSISYTLLSYFIYNILISFNTDLLIVSQSIVMFIVSWAILYIVSKKIDSISIKYA